MKISGFQKLTLLDFPGHVACIVFTGGCNFRCPFCHNALLVTELSEEEDYTDEEILSYLKKRKGIIDGVCITGGEPLLQADIALFLTKIKELGFAVKLDTNGSYPQKLKELVNAGLVDYVAMDIKNSKEKYESTVGVPLADISKIEESVEFLLSGSCDYEFRTTVTDELHSVSDIESAAKWISGAKRYFIQCFVDSGNIIGENLSAPDREKLEAMRKRAALYVDSVSLRGV